MSEIKLRPELKKFAQAMERRLRVKDKKYGDTWKTCQRQVLIRKLREEIHEAFARDFPSNFPGVVCDFVGAQILEDWVDVADCVMFLYDRDKEETL